MPRATPAEWRARSLKYFRPVDVFSGVTWAKGASVGVGGTLSPDIFVEGMTRLLVYAVSDEAWALDLVVLDEDDTAASIMFQAQILTGVGVNNGEIPWTNTQREGQVWRRLRFRGRGLFGAATPNSSCRVHAR